ncbi:MAG: hypothetical protein ABI416_01140 [Ginsengibacter sp.]
MIRYKLALFLVVGCIVTVRCFSQEVIVNAFVQNKKAGPGSDTIYYDFDRSLAWQDFKGAPDNNHFGGAVTASGFAFDSQMNFDGRVIHLDIGVYTFFSKNDSWKKPQINSGYHLLHEQHHFDITRLGSQRFIREVIKARFTRQNYATLLASIFDKVYMENQSIQSQYDRETNHSLNVDKQLEWNTRIAAEIQQLKAGTVTTAK